MDEEADASLNYLSQYLDYSRKRILALEGELETTRRESASHILRLEAENASIHREVATLRGILETKQERTSDRLEAVAYETPVRSEKQGSLEDEHSHLHTGKQSTQLVARTLREELGKIRADSRKLTNELDMVKRVCDVLMNLAMTALQAENDGWRKTCETLTQQTASSTAALVKAKAKYKEVKQDKLALEQTCRELLALVEIMQQEATAGSKGTWSEYPEIPRVLQWRTYDRLHKEQYRTTTGGASRQPEPTTTANSDPESTAKRKSGNVWKTKNNRETYISSLNFCASRSRTAAGSEYYGKASFGEQYEHSLVSGSQESTLKA
ncbi:hypothetical protein DFH06DRAFT_1353847 [Mycena polygramma]|nr:hypothetical protein DFH06DRAFT_1353847 [Mycena polygramma]